MNVFYFIKTHTVHPDTSMKVTHCPHSCRSPSWLQLPSPRCVSSSFNSKGGEAKRNRDSDRSRISSMSITLSAGTTSRPSIGVVTLPWCSEGPGSTPGILTSQHTSYLLRNKEEGKGYLVIYGNNTPHPTFVQILCVNLEAEKPY